MSNMRDDDLIREFLVESYENLDQLDQDFVALEQDPSNSELLSNIFRVIHTIKGSCGFFAYEKLESLTHVGENLLSRLRDGEILVDTEITNSLLAMVDAVREMLASIESTGGEGDVEYSALIGTLSRLEECKTTAPAALSEHHKGGSAEAMEPSCPESPQKQIGEILIEQGKAQPEDVDFALEEQSRGDPRHLGEILVERGVVQPQDVLEALKTQSSKGTPRTIRVNAGVIEKLMALVNELVSIRHQIMHFTQTQNDTAFIGTSERFNLIATELEIGVKQASMQPIGNVWGAFHRLVRDLAMAKGKRVCLQMEGKDTEMDKTIIEAIKDPLTHLVRNAVDHGIETPNERLSRGKPEEGQLFLRAFHEDGHVNIEVSDDGAGIATERVKEKALKKGLITSEQANQMGDREAIHLIFLPGFSTAEKVTNISGRGVGMDVVKTNIETIGGNIDVKSELGQGTTFNIKIPSIQSNLP